MKSREEMIELAENFDGLMTWVFQNDDDLTMEMVMADFALEQIALALTARDAEWKERLKDLQNYIDIYEGDTDEAVDNFLDNMEGKW